MLYAELSTLKIDIYAYVEFKFKIETEDLEIPIPINIRVDLVKELFEGFNKTIYEITTKNITLFISVLPTKFTSFALGPFGLGISFYLSAIEDEEKEKLYL